ncbi:MAG: hypothetical protein AAF770_02115 [Bacteroidota bacterium]
MTTILLSHEEAVTKMKNKLIEEAYKVLQASQPSALIEKLRDVLKVINAIIDMRGLTIQQTQKVQQTKRRQ